MRVQLGGTSYAAVSLSRDDVGALVRPNAINSDEIADGGLEAADLSAAARTALAAAAASPPSSGRSACSARRLTDVLAPLPRRPSISTASVPAT